MGFRSPLTHRIDLTTIEEAKQNITQLRPNPMRGDLDYAESFLRARVDTANEQGLENTAAALENAIEEIQKARKGLG